MRRYRKPLNRSVFIGCIVFIGLVCISLGIISYLSYRSVLYRQYRSYIQDILDYNLANIDNEDLKKCTETQKESDKFYELREFMDTEMDSFDIHYLYALKPLNTNETGNVMSIISAENHYNRVHNVEDNLWLGWISDDEYDAETVKILFDIMEGDETVFFEEKTEWSTDYTGAVALKDSEGKPYGVLAVDVDISDINRLIFNHTARMVSLVIILGALFILIFVTWSRSNITGPIASLEKSVTDFTEHSHGQRDISALSFNAPDIKTGNEIQSLSESVTQMTVDMRDYVSDVLKAEKKAQNFQVHAKEMTELANTDALTEIRNRTAYEHEEKKLSREIERGLTEFGLAMIDLNFLKVINDSYGHEQGNMAIKKLCHVVCVIFDHSPVFRIGGDEFIVILKGHDLEHYEELRQRFEDELILLSRDEGLEPWERVSAAIGAAFYDPGQDEDVASVFKRADIAMYERKKEMKAIRQ